MLRDDRRRYFRINDWVGLSFRAIDMAEEMDIQHDVENLEIDATHVLKSLDKELSATLNTLWKSSPTVASAIALISKKIDIIAAEVGLDYSGLKGEEATTRVNISACGIAFESSERFVIGQKLDMRLTLKPHNSTVTVIGQVIAIERTDEGSAEPYLVRNNFDKVNTSVQEELIQHIVKRQSRQIATK